MLEKRLTLVLMLENKYLRSSAAVKIQVAIYPNMTKLFMVQDERIYIIIHLMICFLSTQACTDLYLENG